MKTKFEICEVCHDTEDKCTCHYCPLPGCGIKIAYDQTICADCRRLLDDNIREMVKDN